MEAQFNKRSSPSPVGEGVFTELVEADRSSSFLDLEETYQYTCISLKMDLHERLEMK